MSALLKTLSALTLLGTLAANALANILPIGGVRTGEVAWRYPNLFLPAGFTFSIWGFIYLLLLIFGIRLLFARPDTVKRLAPWFIGSNLANGLWILAWHHLLPGLALVLMLALLVCLIGFYHASRHGAENEPGAEKMAKRLTASVYLGWITVATIANVSALLTSLAWNGFGLAPEFWYAVVLVVAVALNFTVLWRERDIAYAMVAMWASLGLFMQHRTAGTESPLAAWVPVIAMGFLAVGVVGTAIRTLRGLKRRES